MVVQDMGYYEIPLQLRGVVGAFMEALRTAQDIPPGSFVHYPPNHPSYPGHEYGQPRAGTIHPNHKISFIKLVRQFYGVDLKQAKDIADSLPGLLPALPIEKAIAFATVASSKGYDARMEILDRLAQIK